jgi:predicted acetyltransferase
MSEKITHDAIYDMINKYHNPSLVNPEEAPNANTIYHIYSDGEITYQKGGDAYLCRSEFPFKESLNIELDAERFPKKINQGKYETYGYAIVRQEDALIIRDAMTKLL